MIATMIAQLSLLAYHQTTTWIDLFPFNGVKFTKTRERVIEAAINFVLMSLPPLGLALGNEMLMRFGLLYYFVLFAIECATWWAPYFWGASSQWQEVFDRVHSQTLNVLPRRGLNPRPNLEHLILMLITLTAAFFTFRQFRATLVGPVPSLWIGWSVGSLLTAGTLVQMVRKRSQTT